MPPKETTSKKAGKRPMHTSEKSPKKKSDSARSSSRATTVTAEERANFTQMNKTFFLPTRFLDQDMLREMGLLDEVMEILTHMGLGEFALIKEYTYPYLARDFFATVDLRYRSTRNPDPDDGVLTFKIDRRYYEVSIEDFCGVYKLAHKSRAQFEPFVNVQEFWDLIASGPTSGSPKMSLIRYPPLRIVAKFLANTFYSRKECASIKMGELALLFSGVQHKLLDNDGNRLPCHIGREANLGCLFAKSLASVRHSTKRGKTPICHMGGLLTPLLRFVGIRLEDCTMNEGENAIDRAYLIRCETLARAASSPYMYKYWDRQGNVYTIPLPSPPHTTLTNENLHFEYQAEAFVRQSASTRGSREPCFNASTWELPHMRVTTNAPRKEFLVTAYRIQDRVNRLAKKQTSFLMKQVQKLKAKLRRVSGNEAAESSDEEFPEWRDSDEERYGEDEINADYEEEEAAGASTP